MAATCAAPEGQIRDCPIVAAAQNLHSPFRTLRRVGWVCVRGFMDRETQRCVEEVGAMSFASEARRLAGWRRPHSRQPHRRPRLPAERSRTAGGFALITSEGHIAGFGPSASSRIAALRTGTKALWGSLQFPKFPKFPSSGDRSGHAGHVRVTSCLDAIHHGIDNGPGCLVGNLRRLQRVRPRRRRVPVRPGRSFAGGPRSMTRRW